jgi:hypothetical protein
MGGSIMNESITRAAGEGVEQRQHSWGGELMADEGALHGGGAPPICPGGGGGGGAPWLCWQMSCGVSTSDFAEPLVGTVATQLPQVLCTTLVLLSRRGADQTVPLAVQVLPMVRSCHQCKWKRSSSCLAGLPGNGQLCMAPQLPAKPMPRFRLGRSCLWSRGLAKSQCEPSLLIFDMLLNVQSGRQLLVKPGNVPVRLCGPSSSDHRASVVDECDRCRSPLYITRSSLLALNKTSASTVTDSKPLPFGVALSALN